MEPTPNYYKADNFHSDDQGNIVNIKCVVRGGSAIKPGGKTVIHRCILRGDLAKITLGKYVYLDEQVVLKPPSIYTGERATKFYNMTIGDFVIIGEGSVISAAKIGSNVIIGKYCVISHRVIINENVKILDNTYIPPDTILAPYSVYGGNPGIGKYLMELPESTSLIHQEQAVNAYKYFLKNPDG